MIPTVSEEITRFLLAQIAGVFMGILFDLIKAAKPQKLSKTAADFYDLSCWVILGSVFCVFWQKFLSGKLEWQTILGFVLSLILYFLTIHRPIFTAYCIIKKKISAFFSIFFKFLLTVWTFLSKIVMCMLVFFRKMYIVDCEGKKYEEKQYRI